MANAKSEMKEVPVIVIKEIVTLELEREEARTLLMIMQIIAGSSDTSPRRYTDSIASALINAGVTCPFPDQPDLMDKRYNRINFIDNSLNLVK